MGQCALAGADREPGGGTKLLSLSQQQQQQLVQELQQQIGFSNKRAQIAARACRRLTALPTGPTLEVVFRLSFPPRHHHTQTDFLGYCVSLFDILQRLSEQAKPLIFS